MKSRIWAIILGAVLILSVGLSLWLLWPREGAARAEIWSEGKLLQTLDLSVNQELVVTTESGTNTITVRDGKIAVTAADCPDHYCMDRGYCAGGSQIVCLPHRLIIRFVGGETVDGVAG